ncbi:family 43 glycosylhydrolase [Metabacillus halosaccharovorans]|uniref:family 43 glycosylhydrolase n=1 Tax=Metabacillus halosaccharovorans TaxID=930124 RepID=UPI0009952420|nr:family 43 glycosylhydrolase [Metabacillus halosaccharovorans]
MGLNKFTTPKAPLFRDPIFDGAADPTIIWNHEQKEWWMIYTNRRAIIQCEGVSWVHGTDLGIATSSDGGKSWNYRGVIEGLDFERGRNTFWAPEIIYHNGTYHMYVSYIQGVPNQWAGHKRKIIHYTSQNLWDWKLESILELSSDFVIDACVHVMQDGRFRMWYKDEADNSYTYAADSADLYQWEVVGPVIAEYPHEGPNVFYFQGYYWMIVDKWSGQAVYKSNDCEGWEYNTMILDQPGERPDDCSFGYHADVHVQGDQAFVFYFTHPGRKEGVRADQYEAKRSSIQVAMLKVANGTLKCDRNEAFELVLY